MKLIKQFDENDCGAACLAMIASQFGSHISITKIREVAGTDREGTSLKGMLEAAKKLNLDAKAVKGTEQIFSKKFPVPLIAHLQYQNGNNHFTVISKINEKRVWIYDPAIGKISYKKNDFLKIWSGYLIIVSPTPDFVVQKDGHALLKFVPLILPHIKLLAFMVFISLLLSLFGILSGLYFKFFVDDIIGSKAQTSLHVLSFALVSLTVFSAILTVCRSQVLRIFTMKTDISLSISYIKHVLQLPMNFFETRRTGEILSRFNDSNKIRTTLSNIALGTLLDLLMMFFTGIYLGITSYKLFLILIITVPLSSFVVWAFSKFFSKNYRMQMEQNADLNSYLVEMLGGIPVIKSINAQNHSTEEYERRLVSYIDLGQKAWNYGNVKEVIVSIISGVGANLIYWIGGYLILKDTLSLGELISFNTLAGFFTGPLARFIELQPQIQEAIVAAERIGEIYDLEVETLKNENAVCNSKISLPIELRNVSFRYGARRNTFTNLSFSTGNNRKIAFVGSSGCGKSTLMKLFLHFYDVQEGGVYFGNQNIKDIDTNFLRSRIGYVPQEVYLFSGTVFENIVMGRSGYTLEDVQYACKLAQADIFIEELPDKYYAKISEKGASLSGGERQRIALARALLSKPDILLLDEATSALDTMSERGFQKVVEELGKEIITITIAHRLTTVKNSDIIFVMDKGNIVESGTHKELLTLKGKYYELWNL